MRHEVYFHEHHNCLTLCACAIVNPFIETPQIWHESQLYAVKVQNGRYRFLSKKRFFDEEITQYSGINVEHFTFSSYESFEQKLNDFISQGHFPMVPVDTYYLPYSKLYKEEHNHHWIVFWENSDEMYSIVDHYYKNDEKIYKSIVKSTLDGFKDIHNYDKYQFYVIKTKNFKTLTTKDYLDAIEKNIYKYTQNDDIGKTVPITVMEDAVITNQGLSSFKDIYKSIENDLTNIENLTKDDYETYHEDFLDISHVRYIFSEFLMSIKITDHSKMEEIVELLIEISQDYRLCSNFALKAVYDNQKSMLKMKERLKQLEQKEKVLIKLLDDYVIYLKDSFSTSLSN